MSLSLDTRPLHSYHARAKGRYHTISRPLGLANNKLEREGDMVMLRRLVVTTALCLFASSLFAQETNLATQLQKWNEEIKKTPDEPMSYYRKAQCLMGLGQYDEGYQCAKDAMEKFIKKNHNLAWMLVEKIDFPNYRVDVHFNMGPDERQLPDMGVIHPVSFRIWSKDEDSELLDVFDYEIGLFDGKPSTAAIGQTTGSGNVDYEIFDPSLKYSEVRKMALEVIEKNVKTP